MSSADDDDNQQKETLDAEAVNKFREYLRIQAVHPDINYDETVEFIKRQARDLELPFQVIEVAPNKPVVLITWAGIQPELTSILLNSHMDVVPVFEDKWVHKPFEAVLDEHGNIYGRGAQDMKSLTIEYLEAVRRLRLRNRRLKRTVHMCFVPDEEIGGHEGMKLFVKTKEFRDLNVGFVIDEGMASGTDHLIVHPGEKSTWQMRIHCPGRTGHGSLLLDDTAGEKVDYLLRRFYELRKQEKEKLLNDPNLTIGDITSVNLTQIEGGVQSNVIPEEFVITIDCRVALTVDIDKFEKTINKWCQEAGPGVWIEYIQKVPLLPAHDLDDNHFWKAFKKTTDSLGLEVKMQVLSAATDCRYLREMGVPAIGFSTTTNTPVLAHDHNEFIGKQTFLKGIEIYSKIIDAIGNVEGSN